MYNNIEYLNIIPGNKCDLACSHCANSSGPKFSNSISEEDVKNIIEVLNKNKIPNIILTGGEPTLYIDPINSILSSLEYEPNVTITTNGMYAKGGVESINKVLGQLKKLDHVQLSTDDYHKNLDEDIILNMKNYAENNSKKFNLSYCIESPLDLIRVNELQSIYSVDVVYERITKSGRAKLTNTHFKFPEFEEDVLNRKCPNKEVITFICGKGFSHCCSNLNFNQNNESFYNLSLEKYMESDFYKLSSNSTFGDLIKDHNLTSLSLDSDCSLDCNLCEKIMLEVF